MWEVLFNDETVAHIDRKNDPPPGYKHGDCLYYTGDEEDAVSFAIQTEGSIAETTVLELYEIWGVVPPIMNFPWSYDEITDFIGENT